MSFEDLPHDILNELQQYLPISYQSSWRSVNTQTQTTEFNWQQQCCFEPTKREIVDWIFRQRDLVLHPELRDENDTIKFVEYYQYTKEQRSLTLSLMGTQYVVYTIRLNLHNGKIETYLGCGWRNMTTINTRNELFTDIRGRIYLGELHFHVIFYWQIVRNILKMRTQCHQHGFESDQCLIGLLAKYLPTYDILKPIKTTHKLKLSDKIFNINNIFEIFSTFLDPNMYENILDSFLTAFVPSASSNLSPIAIWNNRYEFDDEIRADLRTLTQAQFSSWLTTIIRQLNAGDFAPFQYHNV